MEERLNNLYEQHKDMIPYLFFGVCTTLVNVVVYWLASHILVLDVIWSTVFAWILAVLFAYVTNRKWVFHSSACGMAAIGKEMSSFFAYRLATGILDVLCMYIFAECFMWNDVAVKLAANVLVIILNYVASKLFIFKK